METPDKYEKTKTTMPETLTDYQAKLLASLTAEFNRLNPVKETTKSGVFSLASITESIEAEQKFKDSTLAFNTSMGKMLQKELEKQIKAFEKEYGELFTVAYGVQYDGNAESDGMAQFVKSSINNGYYGFNEVTINIVSKTKSGDVGRENYNNGKAFFKVYCGYKFEVNRITLPSSKVVKLNKITGIQFSRVGRFDRPKDSQLAYSLDNLIQTDKEVQKMLVYISK